MWPIIGHQRAANLLKNSIISGHLAHAYLFTGPQHVGKSTLATVFAQALNCDQLAEPCGQCRSCRLIAADRHHDVQIIQANDDLDETRASKKSTVSIGIERIRALQRDAALAPYEARYKVYIIPDADNMTNEAANCLLKTLEEPPSRVILILTSTDAKMLLPTVVSRCQQVALAPVPTTVLRQALQENWNVDVGQAARLARISRGCLGWAVNAVTKPKMLSDRNVQLERMITAIGASRTQRFKLAEKLASEFSGRQADLRTVLGLWLEWWRDVLLLKLDCRDLVTNVDLMDELTRTVNRVSLEETYSFARELESTIQYVDANANIRLALEALLLRLPSGDGAIIGYRRQ